MFVVLVTNYVERFKALLLEINTVYYVKEDQKHLYLYVDSKEEYVIVKHRLKEYIREHKVLYMFISFEIYPIYKEKIDLLYYTSISKREESSYYHSAPDLSYNEQEAFYQKHLQLERNNENV